MRHANPIVVLDRGQIVEQGPHQELLQYEAGHQRQTAADAAGVLGLFAEKESNASPGQSGAVVSQGLSHEWIEVLSTGMVELLARYRAVWGLCLAAAPRDDAADQYRR